jgi:hypothetical protein
MASLKQDSNFGTSVEQRLTPTVAQLQSVMDSISQSMRVALPGIVQTFSPGPPATASVIVTTNEYVTQNAGIKGAPIALKTYALQLPVLQDVPVLVPSGGGYSLTFPIMPGDEVLLVFSDTSLDVWLEAGGVNNDPINQRRHSLSDAVAIFGLRSKPRGLSGYSTSSAQLRSDDGSVVIDLAPNHVTVTAPTVDVECSGTATVHGDIVNINGGSQVNITGAGVTNIDGKNFLLHKHTGVQAGSSNTGSVL